MIPSKGKGVVQTGLAVSLPSGVYARIAPHSGLTIKKFIDMSARVIDKDYRGEIWGSPIQPLTYGLSSPGGGQDRPTHLGEN